MCILSNLLTVFVILIMCQISDCSDRMNNVSTEDYLSMNRSRGDFSEIFPEKSLDSKIPGWLCHCYSSIYENEVIFSSFLQLFH